MPKFLSVQEVAKLLGVSRIAIIKQIQTGKLKAQKVGRAYVINSDDLNLVMNEDVSDAQKRVIEKGVERVVKDYGETLRLLKDA